MSELSLIYGRIPGCTLNGFDFGPDSLLYAPSPYESRIVKVDAESGEMITALDGLVVNQT
jgi:hypothetical protein